LRSKRNIFGTGHRDGQKRGENTDTEKRNASGVAQALEAYNVKTSTNSRTLYGVNAVWRENGGAIGAERDSVRRTGIAARKKAIIIYLLRQMMTITTTTTIISSSSATPTATPMINPVRPKYYNMRHS